MRALPFICLAHAKLNLRLEVGPRKGALHTLVSAVAALELADIVRFEPSASGFAVECDLADLPEEDNLAWRAAQGLGVPLPRVRVVIEKRIPTQAGLGGGSADAAATLVGLTSLLASEGVVIEPERVAAAALRAGSDVPSFFASGTRVISGVGEVVTSRTCEPPQWGVVLLRPSVASSTAHAYALLDSAGVPHELDHRSTAAAYAMCDAFCAGELEHAIGLLHNDFAGIIETALPSVARSKERLRAAGATGTILCGSGSCVAGFFEDLPSAQDAVAHIALDEGEWIAATTFARV